MTQSSDALLMFVMFAVSTSSARTSASMGRWTPHASAPAPRAGAEARAISVFDRALANSTLASVMTPSASVNVKKVSLVRLAPSRSISPAL